MFQQVQLFGSTRSPRLIFDVREWYASRFVPGAAGPPRLPDGTVVKTVVRPRTPLTVTAKPTNPPHPRWPFSGPVELVLSRTPSGLLAYFGRVRSQSSPQLQTLRYGPPRPPDGPLRRLPLQATRCLLQMSGSGYLTNDIGLVDIPASYEQTQTMTVELMPAPDYPFERTRTLLRGGLIQPDGIGIADVKIEASSHPNLKPTATDKLGQWALILDDEDTGEPITGALKVAFHVKGGPVVLDVPFLPNRENRLLQTSLRGIVQRADGRPVAGAIITVPPFLGESRTGIDGSWQFFAELNRPVEGDLDVTVRVTPPGQGTIEIPQSVILGKANTVTPITA